MMKCATPCRHCGRGKVNRPRGLCWTCYYTPGIRELHPSTSKFASRGVADFCGPGKLPEPTTALPGTPEKIRVLRERAAAGQRLWHPLDAGVTGGRLLAELPGEPPRLAAG